jgi:hypothetical protein
MKPVAKMQQSHYFVAFLRRALLRCDAHARNLGSIDRDPTCSNILVVRVCQSGPRRGDTTRWKCLGAMFTAGLDDGTRWVVFPGQPTSSPASAGSMSVIEIFRQLSVYARPHSLGSRSTSRFWPDAVAYLGKPQWTHRLARKLLLYHQVPENQSSHRGHRHNWSRMPLKKNKANHRMATTEAGVAE